MKISKIIAKREKRMLDGSREKLISNVISIIGYIITKVLF